MMTFTIKHILIVAIFFLAEINISGQTPSGKSLLTDGLSSLELFGVPQSASMMEVVSVEGQSFSKAIVVNTFNRPSGTGNCGLKAKLTSPLQKGDVMWISFMARTLESKRETDESNIELRIDQLVNGKSK